MEEKANISIHDAFVKAIADTNAADAERQERIRKQAHDALIFRQRKAEGERKECERIANRTPEEKEADHKAMVERLRAIIYGTEENKKE